VSTWSSAQDGTLYYPYGRKLQRATCCALLHLQIVPALTPSQLADMNAAEGTGSPPLQQPPIEVTCLVFEYRRLPVPPTRRAAAITAEAAPAAAAAAAASSSGAIGDYAYMIRELAPPILKGHSSSSSNSSNYSGSRRRQLLQSAANVARQDVLLVYTGAAAANSFNDEYVRASMVNVIAITNKVTLIDSHEQQPH
jgi:hypothetical protein